MRKCDDQIMNELVAHALQHSPERYESKLSRRCMYVNIWWCRFAHVIKDRSRGTLPQINTGRRGLFDLSDSNQKARECDKQLLTGISAWDSAR